MVIWICGLSGSGKTTIGRLLYGMAKSTFPNLVLLDGDEVRRCFGGDLGHDPDARTRASMRIAGLCQLLDRQGIHVICCVMTIAPQAQEQNRAEIDEYYEVLLDVSLSVVEGRDPKGLYARARRGLERNVAGVDIPYVPPTAPDLVLDNNQKLDDLVPLANQIIARTGLLRHA